MIHYKMAQKKNFSLDKFKDEKKPVFPEKNTELLYLNSI